MHSSFQFAAGVGRRCSSVCLSFAALVAVATAHPQSGDVWAVGFDSTHPPTPQYMQQVLQQAPPYPEFFLGPRWPGQQGSPKAITWSFVPDGIVIPSVIGENASPNVLFQRMDNAFAAQGGRAAWVQRVQQTFDRWEELSGIDFRRIQFGGQDWDDGASWGTAGSTARGDIRLCMKKMDFLGGVTIVAAFPGNGDIVMDRAEDWADVNNLNLYLRNTLAWGVGIASGIDLACPTDGTKLMEPIIPFNFDGPRQDDIRAVQRHYGDPDENNNHAPNATPLGALGIGSTVNLGDVPPPLTGSGDPNAALLSIDADAEQDYYSFSLAGPAVGSVTVTPVGSTYDNGPNNGGTCVGFGPFDALTVANLDVQFVDSNGTVLATGSSSGAGSAEVLSIVPLNAAGDYFVRVYENGAPAEPQSYKLSLSITACTVDSDGDGSADCLDGCPLDPFKTSPGICGCGSADVDSDGDGTFDCFDACPNDPLKVAAGVCGCGSPDVDSDGDGALDCVDGCPLDPNKTAPGQCGCGFTDNDSDGDGTADCVDGCPFDPNKVTGGICGCGFPDVDTDGDGALDCVDGCPSDPNKQAPGDCGCGAADVDLDGDGVSECIDNCPGLQNPSQADADGDSVGDDCDNCPNHMNTSQADCDGDGMGDVCTIALGLQEDCDLDGLPDNCEPDCNQNGVIDGCDILFGTSLDQNLDGIPDDCQAPCPAIQTYCTGKVNSVGCTPSIGWTGSPSISLPTGFSITCSNVIPDRNGLMFYGYAASAAPFQGGYLCVKPPFRRTTLQLSVGTGPCNGTYSMDFNAWMASGNDPLLNAGLNVFSRWWMRDPQAQFTTGFSNALTFTICP